MLKSNLELALELTQKSLSVTTGGANWESQDLSRVFSSLVDALEEAVEMENKYEPPVEL